MATRFLKISSNGNKILKSKLMTAPSYMIIFNFLFPFSIASLLAVIHRFMATQTGLQTPIRTGSPGNTLDQGLPVSSPQERSRMASCSSAKGAEQEQALLDLQHVHENNMVHEVKKPMLSREGTVDSEMLDFATELEIGAQNQSGDNLDSHLDIGGKKFFKIFSCLSSFKPYFLCQILGGFRMD